MLTLCLMLLAEEAVQESMVKIAVHFETFLKILARMNGRQLAKE